MIQLSRIQSNGHGTFGVLSIGGVPRCVTLEKTWLDNKPRVSCIPAGSYNVKKFSGVKYKDVWVVNDVPDRSSILIHWGNTEIDTEGCILVGKYYAQFGDKFGVADSKNTIAMLRKKLPDTFVLHIKDCFE